MRLLLATHNEHKRREFQRLLQDQQIDVLPGELALPAETADSFEGNALIKARAAAAATGRVVIADDSGIEAQALGGAPGVRSARYAGERASDTENLEKLIREVPAHSALRYVCVIAYVDPVRGEERIFHGQCTGIMQPEQRGVRGFGYDPVFLPDDGRGQLTMAQLTDAEKDAISHRGRAARALLSWLSGALRTD